MITITPQGNIYLCKTPLESDYKNQLTFNNLNAQQTYFNSTIQKTLAEYTYIRKDNSITVGEAIDTIINCNYLFYQQKPEHNLSEILPLRLSKPQRHQQFLLYLK